jgi:hypothetical protein
VVVGGGIVVARAAAPAPEQRPTMMLEAGTARHGGL